MFSLNYTLSVWEAVLVQLRRSSVSWKGFPLSERDKCTYTEALVLCALHLTDLSSRHDGVGTQRELIAWTKSMVSLDVHSLGSCLSDAVTLLRSVAEPSTYKEFKRSLSSDYPFIGTVLMPIRDALSDFLSDPTPRGFTICYQFLSFLTHLTLVDLPIDQEGEYEETESYLRNLTYDPTMLKGMNEIMREWMKDFTVTSENFVPSHGPGAVAERLDRNVPLGKYRFLGIDALLTYVFSKHADIHLPSYYPFPPTRWERIAKLVSVPKSMKTRRIISKEPTTLMYLQKGVSALLVDYIHKHPYLSKRINLADQRLNADLAISASATGLYATIDLSSASDTVTVELVKAVFRGTPPYPFLIALRSHSVELFSGKVMRVAKFAPMGSALCFPVETLIFACAVEYAVRRAQRTHLGFYPRYRVYGDDIIVQTPVFEDVVLALEGLGFILNRSKSFSSPSRFRESCGGEGYDGIQVTPMKISRRFASAGAGLTSHHAALYEGLIQMANTAYLYDLPLLRAWVIRVLLGNSVGAPLFSGSTDCAIYSPMPDNYRARSRYFVPLTSRTWYQRLEIEVAMVYSTHKVNVWDETLEQARYFETLRQSHKRTGDMFSPEHRISVPRGTSRPKIKKQWVPFPL